MSQRYTRRTPDQWQSIIDEQVASGLSQESFCKRHEVSFSTFQTWRKKLNATTANTTEGFLEVPRVPSAATSGLPLDQGLRVRLELGTGVVLELSRV